MKRMLAVLLSCALLLLAGCSDSNSISKAAPGRNPETAEVPDSPSEPAPYDGPENPLTGLPTETDISQNRPFAISINNIKQAQPQHGVSQADIIYEVLAEGGITRMVAIYQDVSDANVIGSIRSARPYFLDIAQGHDAIFIHAGGSEAAYSAISRRGVANIDGVRGDGSMFYRDSYRKKANGYEHSLMTSGALIAERAGSYGYRMQHEAGYLYQVEFSEDAAPPSGGAAREIYAEFSSYKTAGFLYQEETQLYSVSQYNSAYIDGNTQEQISVKNVLILYAPTKTLDNVGRLSIELTGRGSGYFACGGAYVPISWSKPDSASQFHYTTEDGASLTFGRGVSYICIIPMNATATFR